MKKILLTVLAVATLGAGNVQAQEKATVEFNYGTLKRQILTLEFPVVVNGEKVCHLKENTNCVVEIDANKPVKIEFGEKSFFNPSQYQVTQKAINFEAKPYKFMIIDGGVASFTEGITTFTGGGLIPALIGVGLDKATTSNTPVVDAVPDVLVKNAAFQVVKQ